MRTKLLKSKNLLLACLMAMLITCLAIAGVSFTHANADASTATVGTPYGHEWYVWKKTDDSTYTIEHGAGCWGNFTRLPINNYTSGTISFDLTTEQNATIRIFIYQRDGEGYGNTADIFNDAVAAGATKKISVDAADWIANHTTWDTVAGDHFDIAFTIRAEDSNTVTISSFKIEDGPVVPKKVAIGDWSSTNANLTVQNGTIGDYTGLKVSWDHTIGQYDYISAPVTNFDASKTPNLCVSFYTATPVKVGVWNGDDPTISGGHNDYTPGHYKLSLDVSGQASIGSLHIYFDSMATREEGEKSVVIDYIGFYDAGKELNIAVDDYEDGGNIFTVDNTDDKLSLTWDAKAAIEAYPKVVIPVENWQPFNRYLVLDMTFTDNALFRFFFNGGVFDQWGNPNEVSSLTAGYVNYEKGRHLICLDTAAAYRGGMIEPGGDGNKLYIFLYGGASAEAVTKNVTFNSIRFGETPVEEVTLKVTVDYAARTATYDDTKLEVSAAEDFGTVIASGGAVEPGKLYIRSKADNSMITEITLVKAALTLENAPKPYIEETAISYTNHEGYQFKFGENGEWGDTASWDGLTPGNDYKIYIRKLASDTAFASDELETTVHTEGFAPVSIDFDNYESRDNFITVEKADGKLTLGYDVAQIKGNFYSVSFPVANWRSGNRYLVVDFTLTENTKLGFYLNANDKYDAWGSPIDKSRLGEVTNGKGRYLMCFDTSAAYSAEAISEEIGNKIHIFCDGGANVATSLQKQITLNNIYFSKTEVESVALQVSVDYVNKTITFDETKIEVSLNESFDPLLGTGAEVGPGKLYVRSSTDHSISGEMTLVKAVLTEDNAPKAFGDETSISYEHAVGYQFKFGDDGEWGDTKVWNNLTPGEEYTIYIRKLATDSAFASDEISVKVTVGHYAGAIVALDEYESGSDIFTVSSANDTLTLTWDARDAVNKWIGVNVPIGNWRPVSRYIVLDMSFTGSAQFRFFFNCGKFDTWGNPDEASALTEYITYAKGRHYVCLDTKAAFDAGMLEITGDNKLYIFLYGGANEVESRICSVTFNNIYFSETPVESAALTVTVDYNAGTVDFDDAKLEVSAAADFGTFIAKGGKVGPGKLYIRSKTDNTMTAEVTLVKASISESTMPKAIIGFTSISYDATGYEFKFGEDGEWGTASTWENLKEDTEYTIYVRMPAGDESFASDEIVITKKTLSRTPVEDTDNNGDTTDTTDTGCDCNSSVVGVSLPIAVLLLAGGMFLLRRRRSAK